MADPTVTPTETDGGAGQTHWLDANADFAPLAKDADSRKLLADYKSIPDALKGLVESKRHIATTIRVPDTIEGMPEGDRTKLLTRLGKVLGARDKPEEYELTRPGMPEGLGYDEDHENYLRAWAVKHHVSQAALAELHAETNTRRSKAFEDDVKEHNDSFAKVEQAMTDKFKDDWAKKIKPGLMTLLVSLAKKTGVWKDGQQARADIADGLIYTKDGVCTPLMAALAQLYVDFGQEGVTKITGGLGGTKGGELDIDARWPASASVMR